MEVDCKNTFSEAEINNFGSSVICEKYERFKTNLKHEIDKNVRWCPQCYGAVKRQKTCCFSPATATCACGQEICFKCGEKSHLGQRCKNDNNANYELKKYMQ